MDKFIKRVEKDATVIPDNDDYIYVCNESADSDKYRNTKKRKMGFSTVWKYFKKSDDKKLAKCTQCGNEYKTSGNTSNLLDHLKRFHPNLERKMDETISNQDNHPSTSSSNSNSAQASMKSVDSYFKRAGEYEKNSRRKENIDRALVNMVTTDLRPLNIVKNDGFIKYTKCLDPRYVLPSAKYLRDVLLKNKFNEAKLKLKNILCKVSHVAITCDGWTSIANQGYLSTTCHFVDDDMELRSAVLSTEPLLEATNHSASNIAEALRASLTEWNVFNKVRCVVTDNAAVMLSACNILQKKKHLPCYAHTLNLVVQDQLSQNENLKNLRKKCRGIVHFFKSSVIAYQKFKLEQNTDDPYSLIQEVPTRWNSTYAMIKRIIETNQYISKVLLLTSKAHTPFTADEVNALKEVASILEIFQTATEKVSGNNYVTVSLIIPISYGIYEQLCLKQKDLLTPEGLLLCSGLIESARKRLTPYETRTVTRMATILDPRFKKEGFESGTNAAQAAIKLEEDISLICAKENEFTKTNANNNSNTTSAENIPSLFGFLQHKINSKNKTSRSDAIIIIRHYMERENISSDADPLLYWKVSADDFKPLKMCMLNYFCIPATSTESERTFSKAGLIISNRRSRLKPKNVNMQMFLHKNDWILKK